MSGFDIQRFTARGFGGHIGRMGLSYYDSGADWVSLALPYAEDLVGEPETGVVASGPIVTMMDTATSLAVWVKLGRFQPQATLDLRVDYLRPARPGKTVIGRGECVKITRSVAFVRGVAYDEGPDDPLAQVAGTFMLMSNWS
ncbi:PaaI family thioesterase [Sphingomonas sp. MA1305]|uniref:PaaI family thioesterase n=1 Tax=Sphingomonas sp. MA1305 TaxID=2479204 RepID=UPI0018DF3865|nr:PaaI family thioesterase [Sphingomonas sp. MA1305]MBI0474176.1 PaaI family thioesterase [Sphingomonas sp. MA1305]